MSRLPKVPTQRIDQNQTLSFNYRKKNLYGFVGDTLATALYANGVRIFSRSLKYHRPRGLYSLDGISGNCLMAVNGMPNVQTETTPLEKGMVVEPQNVMGSPENDLLSILDKFDALMPAGFYYGMFHRPYRLWPFFQKILRQAAGTGVIDKTKQWDKSRYEDLNLHSEICIIGGGPASMAAAIAAADQGCRVVLLEARPWLGGFYDWRTFEEETGHPPYKQAQKSADALKPYTNIRVFKQAFVNNLVGDNLVTGFQVGGPDDDYDQRYFEIRAHSVVVATGCIERPLLFENNDRPGIMQIACALRLANTYGIMPGGEAVFSVGDDLGLEAAATLADLGLKVIGVADARKQGHNPALTGALAERNIPFFPGWVASRAEGKRTVHGAVLGDLSGKQTRHFDCDLLIASAGLTPITGHLTTVGAKMTYDPHTGFFLPTRLPPRVHVAGRLLGYTDPRSIEASGRLAGLTALQDTGAQTDHPFRETKEMLAELPGPASGCHIVTGPRTGSDRKCFICFDEDGTLKAVRQSIETGFDIPELAKRFGGFGLGPGQGGIPNHNLPLVMAKLRGDKLGSLVPTTVRSPLIPTLMMTYAGSKQHVFKQTPLHREQERLGGVFRTTGAWKRARYFSEDVSSRQEIQNIRNHVGLIDISTLGKFRIFGTDALKALQRVYISDMNRTTQGKLKYSAMLNEDGCLKDDGVITPVGKHEYYFTTSTTRAGETIQWFRYHTRFENWDFHMINLTDALGAINLAGPKSREVLTKITDANVSNDALPYMGYQEILLGGIISASVLRLGFVGELSYELHVPASQTQTVWEWLMEAGEPFGIQPFGLEAQSALRLEKGHVIIGQESEQRTNLLDLGMGFLWDRKDTENNKVGAPALRFAEDQPDRMKLVGFQTDNSSQIPGDGSVIYEGDNIIGYVCTCRFSTTLDKIIGLALVKTAVEKTGDPLNIYQNDGRRPKRFTANVVSTPFYDPKGHRLRM